MTEGCSCGCHKMGGGMSMGMYGWSPEAKKEFKLAILKKKEKMLKAKLEFLQDMMKMVENMPKEKKEDM